jgi:putative oxidoreductase
VTAAAHQAYAEVRTDMAIATRLLDTRLRLLNLTRRLAFVAPLVIRVTVGVVFIGTGWGKLSDLPQTVETFRDFGVPLPGFNAPIAAVTEFAGGILLLLGLGARLAALPMAFTMLVAILTAKRDHFDGFQTFLGFEEWSYLVMFITIAVIGPGAISVDAFIARRLDRHADAPAPAVPGEPAPAHV